MGAISEKLVYLNGTKQAIKQAINEDFEVIDDNTTFREYADEISSNNAKYKDLIPKETTNATNTLDISNSSGLDKALVTQYGNTYQEGEPTPDTPQEIVNISGKSTLKDVGKNLFDKNAITERSYVLNDGTLQTGTSYEYNTSDFIPVQPNTTYYKTLSLSPRTKFYDANKQVLDSSTYQDISIGGNEGSFTTPANAYYFRFTINTNVSTGVSLDSVMVHKGSEVSAYEPYKEQSFDLALKSKNLFDKDNVIVGKVYNSNGELVNSGQWNTNNDFEKVNENKVSISCKTTGTVNSLLIEFDKNKDFIQRQQVNYISSSLTLNTNTKYIRYCYQNTLGMYDIQIEENPTATEYEPYYDINLCEIDTYKDRIYPLNGKWYLENFSEKVTIDGTNIAVTNRRETNTSGNYSFTFLFSKKAKRVDGTTTQGGYCDKLVSKPRNNIYGRTQGFGYGATNNDYWGDIVIFRTGWATKTVADVNTDLKSNPIELEYLLDSAETIEITESNYPTLYNQLNNIKLYEGVNHITMTNESGLDVEFDIEYYKDWKLD